MYRYETFLARELLLLLVVERWLKLVVWGCRDGGLGYECEIFRRIWICGRLFVVVELDAWIYAGGKEWEVVCLGGLSRC